MVFRRSVPLLLLVTACPADTASTVTDTGSTGSASDTSDTGSTTGAPEGTSSSGEPDTTSPSGVVPTTSDVETTDPTTSGTTVAPDPICGNGFVEGEEPCDDGNDEVDDGCNSKCQRTGVPVWTQSWDSGDKKDDYGDAVAIDAEGNIYVVGTSASAEFQRDAIIRKLDPEGKELLKFSFAGQLALEDNGLGIAVGEDGSIYVVGAEQIVDDGPFQGWARKYDKTGKELWAFVRASALPDVGTGFINGIAVDGDIVYVAGRESDTEKNIFRSYLMRLDGSDTPVWSVETPDAAGTNFTGVAVTPDGDVVFAAGLRDANKDVTALVAKYTADGDEVWSKTFLEKKGYANAVAVAEDGTIAVAGLAVNVNDLDLWVARLDADGAEIWNDKYDSEQGTDIGFGVAHGEAGDIYVSGYVTLQGQSKNATVRRYTPDGALYWVSTYNDEENLFDSAAAVAVHGERVVVTGTDFVLGSGSNHWTRAYEL